MIVVVVVVVVVVSGLGTGPGSLQLSSPALPRSRPEDKGRGERCAASSRPSRTNRPNLSLDQNSRPNRRSATMRKVDHIAPPTAGNIVRATEAKDWVKPWIRPCAAGSEALIRSRPLPIICAVPATTSMRRWRVKAPQSSTCHGRAAVNSHDEVKPRVGSSRPGVPFVNKMA